MRKQELAIQSNFSEAYEQAVADGLAVLGKQISLVISSYIEEKYSIRIIDTADNPKALSDALYATIDGGTRIVQRRILRSLYNRIGIELPFTMTLNFEDKIHKVKKEYEKKNISSS
jgi:hypothetical protein